MINQHTFMMIYMIKYHPKNLCSVIYTIFKPVYIPYIIEESYNVLHDNIFLTNKCMALRN